MRDGSISLLGLVLRAEGGYVAHSRGSILEFAACCCGTHLWSFLVSADVDPALGGCLVGASKLALVGRLCLRWRLRVVGAKRSLVQQLTVQTSEILLLDLVTNSCWDLLHTLGRL